MEASVPSWQPKGDLWGCCQGQDVARTTQVSAQNPKPGREPGAPGRDCERDFGECGAKRNHNAGGAVGAPAWLPALGFWPVAFGLIARKGPGLGNTPLKPKPGLGGPPSLLGGLEPTRLSNQARASGSPAASSDPYRILSGHSRRALSLSRPSDTERLQRFPIAPKIGWLSSEQMDPGPADGQPRASGHSVTPPG